MKYGLFWNHGSRDLKKEPVDMHNLPEKCCAHCDNWVNTGKCYGACTINCDNEYDYFSYADDCCDDLAPVEEE